MAQGDRLPSESELRPLVAALVKQELAELLGVAQQDHRQQWYKPAEAAKLLDLESPELLHKLRRSGALKQGKNWRDTSEPDARRSTYQYRVDNCRQFLERRH